MGCGHDKRPIFIEEKAKEILYEEYDELDPYTFMLTFYNLTWKKRPEICMFQKISEEVAERSKMKNLNIILKNMTFEQGEKMKYLINDNQIIFYVFCTNGVIITRNEQKINYYITHYLDNIINVSFVDISLMILQEKEYFSIYELKRQSKFFYDLNSKEIDFTNRNKLANDGKLEQLSDLDDIEEEIEMDEKGKETFQVIDIRINKNHFNGEYMKKENDNFLGINDADKDKRLSISKMDINSILNKEKENLLLKEIKDYGNKSKSKKSKKDKNSKNNLKITKTLKLLGKIEENNNNKEENKNDEKNNKNKNQITKNKTKNSKSKEKSSKNDKLLFKNKKVDKIKNLNIKVYPVPKQIPTVLNDSNNVSKIGKLNNIILKENNNNINNNVKKDSSPSPFEVKDKCLIISTNKLTKEINSQIQKILFVPDTQNSINIFDDNDNKIQSLSTESSFDHVKIILEDKNKKKKPGRASLIFESIKIEKNRVSIRPLAKEEKINDNDYIIIFNKNKIPFDKKKSSHNIDKVYFKNCNFDAESTYYLKELICMLTKYDDLKKIYFSKNEHFLSWKFLKQLFRENFNIRWVSFKDSKLNDHIFENIISALFLKRVRYLNFSKNNISNKGIYSLNTFLIKNQTLSVLNLSYNPNINKDGIKLILNSLKLHPNIYKLDISYMPIEGSGEYISSLLKENKSINMLFLKNDKLNSKDIEFISKELSKRESTLGHLDLSDNPQIGDEGLKEIGKLIYNNKSLKVIGLDGMNLSINNYLPIFNGIFKNKTIENYSMSKNRGLPLKGILNFFQKNPQVKVINIIPWDIENPDENEDEEEEENKFNEEEIFLLEKFHLKAPNVTLIGINFIDT